MFSKFFPLKYFSFKYFDKGSYNPLYSKHGDIETSYTKDYSNDGDIKTVIGEDLVFTQKTGDVWATLLKTPPQIRVSFGYDIQTELT